MHLSVIPPSHVDHAWKDGASRLAEACAVSGGEITGDQLKMLLSRGERVLVAGVVDGKPVAWAAYQIHQLPNVRVLHVTDMAGHGFVRFWGELVKLAEGNGCSEIRFCPGTESRARLFKTKLGAELVYATYRVRL